MMRRSLILLLVLPLLAACLSKTQWQNPDVPSKQWSRDVSACGRWAAREAEKEYGRDLDIESDRGLNSGGPLSQQTGLYGTRKRKSALKADCLRARGYQRVKIK